MASVKSPFQTKIIGGKFGLPIEFFGKKSNPNFLSSDPVLLFNARSGIKLAVDQLKPAMVWVPSYLCPTILRAIEATNARIAFYPVNDRLQIIEEIFIDQIKAGDLILLINYFGFPIEKDIIERLKTKECLIIRDCCQALFFDCQSDPCDMHLYSPRKFLGVTDGGILHFNKKLRFQAPTLAEPESEVLYTMLRALILRREFDLYGGDRPWHDLFQQAERRFIPEYRSMSELTKLFLFWGFDYEFIAKKRRMNYQALAQKLGRIALFPELVEDVVPLGFPIRVENRDQIQKELFKHNIFPPIHWDIHTAVPKEFQDSHLLAKEIMTLPCDQRYDENDMERLAEILLRVMQ